MSKAKKSSIIIAIVFIVCGFAISFTAFAVMGFDYKKFETIKYEMEEMKPEGDFSKITVNSGVDVKFVLSQDGSTRVSYPVYKKATQDIRVENGTLKVLVEKEDWHWTNIFVPHISISDPKVTIYLPKDTYESLMVETFSGDVVIPADFTFGDMTVKASSGDVSCKAQVTGTQNIKTTSGNIVDENTKSKAISLIATSGDVRLEAANVTETLEVKTFSGDIVLKNIKGGAKFTAEHTSGNLYVEDAEFDDATMEGSSGNTTLKNMSVAALAAKASSGDLWLGKVQATGTVTLKTSSGDITVKEATFADTAIEATSGEVYAEQTKTQEFECQTTSGDIVLKKFDADNLTIKASSGDVRVELRSAKNYTVHTNSGSTNYPDDGGNGTCKVTTSSGDVRIKVAN